MANRTIWRSQFGSRYLNNQDMRRKLSRFALGAISAATCGFFMPHSALAQAGTSLWWDINGAASGAGGSAPSGNWDLVTKNWNTDSFGASATTTWTAGDAAAFAAGTDATGAYTVTIPTGVMIPGVNTITTEEGNVTIACADSTSGLVLTGGTITLANAATISASIGGSAGLIASGGTGTLTLSGSNSFSGQTQILSAGRIVLTNSNALGSSDPASNIVFNVKPPPPHLMAA